jgi:hypothetical protein
MWLQIQRYEQVLMYVLILYGLIYTKSQQTSVNV